MDGLEKFTATVMRPFGTKLHLAIQPILALKRFCLPALIHWRGDRHPFTGNAFVSGEQPLNQKFKIPSRFSPLRR